MNSKVVVLRVEIEGISPPIWRRIAIDSTATLRELHHVIQAAFGWTDAHLHEFTVEDQTYAMLDNVNVLESIDDLDVMPLDDRKAKLARLMYVGQVFTYFYDFGDSWTHHIKIEKIDVQTRDTGCAVILSGERSGPPEDVGGASGYARFLDAIINDPGSQKAQESLDWVGGAFDPEAFDRRIANNALLRMAWNGWGKKS